MLEYISKNIYTTQERKMKKRILLFTMLLTVVICMFAIVASAETPEKYIEFSARFEGSNDYITVYTENAGTTDAPAIDFAKKTFYSDVDFTKAVDMTTATGLDFSEAYSNNTNENVKSVTKPSSAFTKCVEVVWFEEGVTTIPNNFFKEWSSLSSFDFGCAEVIGRYAFEKTVLTKLNVPLSVSDIGNYAFRSCEKLQSLSFENDVVLGQSVFAGCTSLESIDISKLTIIGKLMFDGCTALTSVTIPNTITNIGDNAFQKCSNVTSVVFEDGFSGVIGTGAFKFNTNLETVTLCEGITSLPNQCFYQAGKLTKIVIPDSVKSLGDDVFYQSPLSEFVLGENTQLESFDGNTFRHCKSLRSISLPTGVKIVATNLFLGCTSLERVENFENVIFASEKGENVFVGTTFESCSSMKEIRLPLYTAGIDGNLNQLTSLETIYIPASVKSITNTFANSISANVTIYYCGGNAVKLLGLTDNGNGVTSTNIKTRINNKKTVEYKGADTEYPKGYIVYNANSCDLFYEGEHIKSLDYLFTFIDENGIATDRKYVSDLKVSYQCSRNCGLEVTVEILPAVLAFNGYSMPEDGTNAITVGYLINNKSIKSYEEYTNSTLNVGVFAVAKNQIVDGDIFNKNGEANTGVVYSELKNDKYFSFDFKIKGFTTEAHKNALLAIGIYVFDNDGTETELTYVQASEPQQNEKYSFISYNQILNS